MPVSPTYPIRVVIIDDSAFMRRAISQMLSADPEIQVVGSARDGHEGLEKVRCLKPHVVTLDVEMPRLGGLETLKCLMREMPLPVLMVSSLTTEGAAATFEALDLGAVDFIPKNLGLAALNILKIQRELIVKVKAAARSRKLPPSSINLQPDGGAQDRLGDHGSATRFVGQAQDSQHPPPVMSRVALVTVGASTGGPKAVQTIVSALPADMPCIFVVQHMPPAFTSVFAERLNRLSVLEVKEASEGMVIQPGLVLVAPGGKNLRALRRTPLEAVVSLSPEPVDSLYCPSVDVTLKSAAVSFPRRCLGVILTGMGSDGREGAREIRRQGGKVLAQDEQSCVIYGMPRAVVEAGLADKVVPLELMPGEILNLVQATRTFN